MRLETGFLAAISRYHKRFFIETRLGACQVCKFTPAPAHGAAIQTRAILRGLKLLKPAYR